MEGGEERLNCRATASFSKFLAKIRAPFTAFAKARKPGEVDRVRRPRVGVDCDGSVLRLRGDVLLLGALGGRVIWGIGCSGVVGVSKGLGNVVITHLWIG